MEEKIIKGNYRNRFVRKYSELKKRYNELHRMIIKYQTGTLDFIQDTSMHLL